MSYVDEVIEQVVAQNPAEPEFHQAVKEVLESLKVVIEANEEEYKKKKTISTKITKRVVNTTPEWMNKEIKENREYLLGYKKGSNNTDLDNNDINNNDKDNWKKIIEEEKKDF